MTVRALFLAGSAALIAVPASALSDFRLPGSTSAPSPTPTAVGPVDPERPAPRPTATPTPSPRPTIAPTPTPPPVLAIPTAAPTGQGARPTPAPRPTPAARAPATGASAAPGASETGAALPSASSPALPPLGGFAPQTGSPAAEAAPPQAAEEGGLPWSWIAGFAALIALLAFGWVQVKRRIMPRGMVLLVPDIEKPRVPPPAPETPPAGPDEPSADARLAAPPIAEAPASAAHPLHIAIEPIKLTQTMMNAALSYRLTLSNKGEAALENLAIAADLVAAHASRPREDLTAGPDTDLPVRHEIGTLAPGETVVLKGDLRLPLAQAMPIRQGKAVVFVPLARFRANAAAVDARCFTLVVGQPSPRGAIQPVRLDLGPRTTDGLTGLAF